MKKIANYSPIAQQHISTTARRQQRVASTKWHALLSADTYHSYKLWASLASPIAFYVKKEVQLAQQQEI